MSTDPRRLMWASSTILALVATQAGVAQQRAAAPAAPRSAPVTNLRYEVAFDSATAATRTMKVSVAFDVAGPGPVLLSFPAWTPGAYEITNFARWISNFEVTGGGRPLTWDKLDYDTYRLQPGGAKSVTVQYDYLADTLDNAMAWARPDFAFFNGTNVLPYPEGRGFAFPATVSVKTQPGWLVVSGMATAPAPGSYREGNYHDLVDKPFFVGRMDVDSQQVEGRWHRLATYPAGTMAGPARALIWDQIGKMMPPMSAVFQETPWQSYTTMMVFTQDIGGGSALEHSNSHLGIYNPGFIGNPLLASITAHEIFHAWNVKRMRPADMWPYLYDRAQETTWLWVSEGITDYYADLAMVRGGIVDSAQFLGLTMQKIGEVQEAPPTALEDASLSTWIGPTNGTRYLYYPKGSLAGLLLDVLIRDGSDNRRSLDDLMREVYRASFKQGRGFTPADWWRGASRLAGGRSFTEFNAKYIDGREPLPWSEVLPLAGLRLRTDTLREPRLGVSSSLDSTGAIVIHEVVPGSPAEEAGVKPGDVLLSLGDVPVDNPDFGLKFRERFGKSEGDSLPIHVRRGGETLTLPGRVRLGARVETRLEADPAAGPKAARIRSGILRGVTDK
ncbi:MAG TPA: PDZ domain-containing protein [Gemmatimonadales bacterium]|nr:PDZ domain-containing protein [Gemmatimonadales bacterium]